MTSDLRGQLRTLPAQLRKHGFEVDTSELDPPAPPAALSETEAKLGRALPRRLREFLANVSGRFELNWGPGDDLEAEHPEFCGFGRMHWDVASLPAFLESARSWGKEAGPEDPWNCTLPIVDFQDGDYLAVELGDPEQVILLWHEGGEDHGRVIAPDFPTLIGHWVQAGFDRSFLFPGGGTAPEAMQDAKRIALWQKWVATLGID